MAIAGHIGVWCAWGGYPDLHTGAIEEDRWADYLMETVFERVLGVDIPDLFPVDQPRLLRHLYMEAARKTGFRSLAEDAVARVLDGQTSLEEISRIVDLTDRIG